MGFFFWGGGDPQNSEPREKPEPMNGDHGNSMPMSLCHAMPLQTTISEVI